MTAGDVDDVGLIDTISSSEPPEGGRAPPRGVEELAGRYVLIDEIGEGGGGVVFRAFDRELGRQVAIKLLSDTGAARPHLRSMRMRREAQANALLAHPNVVSVFDVGDHDGEIFIAMEYVDGGSLEEWLSEPRSVDEIAATFLQAGLGLHAAHEKGIIHRDFKPANVLMGRDGRARVADFGLARGVRGHSAEDDHTPAPGGLVERSLTRTGTIMGTPSYMAPEQFGRSQVDARADQFAFCLAFAEALTGTQAPRGELQATGWTHAGWDPKAWLRQHAVPARLRAALARGLSLDPEERFDSMTPVIAAIRAYLGLVPRRRAVFVAAAMVALVGIASWSAWRERQACVGLEAGLAGVWDDARRTRLVSEVRDGPAAGWEEVWTSVDRWADHWVSARTAVCEATRVRGEQSDELLDVRMACLDRRLEGLRVLLALVDGGELAPADRVSDALLRLPGPQVCPSAQALDAAPPPADPEAARQAEIAERAFPELEALYAAGLTEAGVAKSASVAAAAKRSEHVPVRAQAERWRARFAEANDAFEEAGAAWEQTLLLAEAAADDGLRFEAMLALLRLDQGEPATAREADKNAAWAKALLARQNGGARQRSALSAALGKLAYRRGDFTACREHGERAVVLVDRTPDVALFERLLVKEDLAQCLEQQGMRRRAAEVLREALADAERELGPRHSRVGLLQGRLSRALDFSGDHAGAEEAAQRAFEITMATLGDRHTSTALAYQALANVKFRKNDFAGSAENLARSIEILTAVHGPDSQQVGAMKSSYGLSLSRLGRYDDAATVHAEAVAALTASAGPRHPLTGAALGRLGANLDDQGDCEGALPYYRRAIEVLRESDPEHGRILDQVRGLAGCLLKLGRHGEAKPTLLEGLDLSRRRDEGPYYTSMLELMAAQAMAATGERTRGRALARSALERLRKEAGVHAELEAEIRAWLKKTK